MGQAGQNKQKKIARTGLSAQTARAGQDRKESKN
jgi:hypothetical protein